MNSVSRLAFSVVALACLAGCGGSGAQIDGDRLETVTASGIVTLDGKPFGPGTVELIPVGGETGKVRGASAAVDDEGAFVLGTYDSEDGAVPGKYKVSIARDLAAGPVPAIEPLELEVAAGGSETLAIELKTSAKGVGDLLSPKIVNPGAPPSFIR